MARNMFWRNDLEELHPTSVLVNKNSSVLATDILLQGHTMTKDELMNESINWGLVYSFRGSGHDHRDGKQTGLVMEQ